MGKDKQKHFGTINISKIKSWAVLRLRSNHNNRKLGVLRNDDAERFHLNEHCGRDGFEHAKEIIANIKAHRKELGLRKLRRDAVPVVEVVIGASHEFFKDKTESEIQDWKQTQIDFAKNHFKEKGTIVQWDFHRSEKSNHIHFLFVPKTKDKKQNPTLSAKAFQGNRKDMMAMHSGLADANKKFGLNRGKNYLESGEEQPDYIDDLKEFKKMTIKAKKLTKKNVESTRTLISRKQGLEKEVKQERIELNKIQNLILRTKHFFQPSTLRKLFKKHNDDKNLMDSIYSDWKIEEELRAEVIEEMQTVYENNALKEAQPTAQPKPDAKPKPKPK